MVRVLNIIGGLQCGGLEGSVVNYYRNIDRTKIQYDFLITTDEGKASEKHYFEDEVISLGARIFRRPTRSKHPIKNVRVLFKIIKENPDIKIVHVYATRPMKSAFDCMWAMKKGIHVRIVYAATEICYRHHIAQKMFRPMLRATATHYLVASTEAGIAMFGDKVKDKLMRVPRARDLDAYRYSPDKREHVRHEMGLSDLFVVLTVGSLSSIKNQSFLIEAFADAAKKQPDMVLLIAGEGKSRTQLESKIAQLSLADSVRLLGLRDDVPDLLQAADLFVLPSLREGLPGAAIEAQAAGLPCLLSEAITRESKVTDAVEFLPIDKGFEIWAKRMIAYRNIERRDTSEDIRRAGLDIKDAAKWLENLYLETLG